MATIVRLRREGTVHKAFWSVIVTDSRKPKDCIEQLGTYDNLHKPPTLKVNQEKALWWISRGATPTPTVRQLFHKHGVLPKGKSLKPSELAA